MSEALTSVASIIRTDTPANIGLQPTAAGVMMSRRG
jgi:hypothetical protein